MSYPLDTAAQNAALDALLSRDLTNIPTVWEVAFYDGHPLAGGTELTGYTRPLLNADLTDWPAAASGRKDAVSVDVTVTVASSDTASHYLLIDHGDSTTRWFPGVLPEDISFDTTGVVAAVIPAAYFNTGSI